MEEGTTMRTMRRYDVTVIGGAPGRSSLRPIEAYSPLHAAEVAAERLARRLGKQGTWMGLEWDFTTLDGRQTAYKVFLGKKTRDGVDGVDVWIYLVDRC